MEAKVEMAWASLGVLVLDHLVLEVKVGMVSAKKVAVGSSAFSQVDLVAMVLAS